MKLKQAIGLVFHKLLDWKTAVNPLTNRLFPELYHFQRITFYNQFRSKRKLNTRLVATIPSLGLVNMDLRQSRNIFFHPFVREIKVLEGNTKQKETGSKKP